MKLRSNDMGGAATAFTGLSIGWLTWTGFALAGAGWGLLLFAATLVEFLVARAPHFVPATFHGDLVEIAKSVVVSGFGLAIVGSLQTGFGTLNRFFGAVLMRSAQRETTPVRPAEPVVERPTAPTTSIKRRPYRTFADGSVEVDTIVGTRLFKTMTEARDFI